MNRHEPSSCWPTTEQQLLLQAALLRGEAARTAWERWRSTTDIERIDPGSHRLLPLLYRNLRVLGIDDPLIGKLKGVYRRSWYENQLLLRDIATLVRQCHEAGIETMLLKGSALVLLHYREHGVRPMVDGDVLVRPEQALAAVHLLQRIGWKPVEPFLSSHLLATHGHSFVDSSGREIDLHWHVLHECCTARVDEGFWARAVPVQVHDVVTRALDPTDQLLHVCVHGARWNVIPTVRWVADAMAVLGSTPTAIAWERLVNEAQQQRLTLPLRDTLTYLREVFAAPVPLTVLSTLQQVPISRTEHIEHQYKTHDHRRRLFGYLPVLWFDYQRSDLCLPPPFKVAGFLRYLQYFWGLPSLRQACWRAATLIPRRLQAVAHSYAPEG